MQSTATPANLPLYTEALELLRTLAAIASPTGAEHKRAQFVAAWFLHEGFADVRIDKLQNVVVRVVPAKSAQTFTQDGTSELGKRACEGWLFSAHTDVVFDDADTLPVHEDAWRIYAPGVGDDTANLVVLMLAAREVFGPKAGFAQAERLARPVYIVANTQEEGLGNLRGTRAVFEQLKGQIAAHVCFDLYAGQVISQAVGSRRWRVSVECAGGHSWQDAGAPSATERLCALVEHLMGGPVPDVATAPGVKTTQNVGTLSGGTTVNAIAAHAQMLYEVRSTSESALAAMDARLHTLAAALEPTTELQVHIDSVGVRPASANVPAPALAPLTKLATQLAKKHFPTTPLNTRAASTDANIALSLGLPALCVGTISGGLLHTRQEYVDKSSLAAGIAFACDLMGRLAVDDELSGAL